MEQEKGSASSTSDNGLISQCDNIIPNTTDVSPVVRQWVAYEIEIQLDRTQYTGSANAKAAQIEALVHAELAQALLGTCAFDGTYNPEVINVRTHSADTVQDIQRDDPCPVGLLCWIVECDFTMDIFYHLESSRKRRELGEQIQEISEQPPRQRRELQQGSPPMKLVLEDSSLMTRLGYLLKDVYDALDTEDGSVYKFRYFTNPAALDSTGDATIPEQDRGGIAAATASDESSLPQNSNAVVASLGFGGALLVLIIVAMLAVQRRRRSHAYEKAAAKHFMLDDDDERDEFYDDDEYTTSIDDKEMHSSPRKVAAGADDILADLQSFSGEDQEAASYATTSFSRKVYVLSDAASTVASNTGSFEMAVDPNWTPNGLDRQEESPTVFVKTNQLKESMKDLKPTKVKSNTSSTRSYVADDTVDL